MPIIVTATALPEVKIIEPKVFGDDRGFFYESFNQRDFESAVGVSASFVQDNHSKSEHSVLRGLHYQISHPQGKLVRVISGTIFDVAVDLRKASTNFGKWIGVELSSENQKQLWVPAGFAHGFMVTSPTAEVLYKTTDYWHPKFERSLLWNDPAIGIGWPETGRDPTLAQKDAAGSLLIHADTFDF